MFFFVSNRNKFNSPDIHKTVFQFHLTNEIGSKKLPLPSYYMKFIETESMHSIINKNHQRLTCNEKKMNIILWNTFGLQNCRKHASFSQSITKIIYHHIRSIAIALKIKCESFISIGIMSVIQQLLKLRAINNLDVSYVSNWIIFLCIELGRLLLEKKKFVENLIWMTEMKGSLRQRIYIWYNNIWIVQIIQT